MIRGPRATALAIHGRKPVEIHPSIRIDLRNHPAVHCRVVAAVDVTGIEIKYPQSGFAVARCKADRCAGAIGIGADEIIHLGHIGGDR